MVTYSSYWLDLPYHPRPALDHDIETDIVIIGGGITGTSTAYHCAKQGLRTVLIEKDLIASGSAGKNGGMVVEGLSEDLIRVCKQLPQKHAVLAWNKTRDAQALVKEIISAEEIACDYKEVGSAYTSKTVADTRALKRELALRATHHLSGTFVAVPAFQLGVFTDAIINPKDATLHPVKFVRGLACAAERAGAQIYEHTPGISYTKSRVQTPHGIIRAKKVILALESLNPALTKQDGFYSREGALVTKPLSKEALARLNWKGTGMFWDSARNYLTVRKIGNRLFACTGVSKRESVANAKKYQAQFLGLVRSYFPRLKDSDLQVSHYWTGLLFFPKGIEPTIRKREGCYEVFGTGGLGLTFGTMAGKNVAELVGKTRR